MAMLQDQQNAELRKHFRSYNATFAFTSTKVQSVCHGLGYFGILWAMSCPKIFLDTFGNIMA
jgi:hypothetical protein